MSTSDIDSSHGVVLVDGFNLLHAAVLKGRERGLWWDVSHQRQVRELVGRYPGPGECWTVFDAKGEHSHRLPEAERHQLVYAPSADDWIVEFCRTAPAASVIVVSADRSLQDRARNHGARRVSPWAFAEECIT